MNSADPNNAILQAARELFPAFYGIATTEDAVLFDELALSFVALTQRIDTPWKEIPGDLRMSVERESDEIERRYMKARERVRICPTFKKVELPHRRRIAASLFDVFPPTEYRGELFV